MSQILIACIQKQMSVCVCVRECECVSVCSECVHLTFPANLSHLCQVQGGPLLLGIFWSPALHTNLFVV